MLLQPAAPLIAHAPCSSSSRTSALFQINSAKHVPVITLSININIKFLENLKQGLKQ